MRPVTSFEIERPWSTTVIRRNGKANSEPGEKGRRKAGHKRGVVARQDTSPRRIHAGHGRMKCNSDGQQRWTTSMGNRNGHQQWATAMGTGDAHLCRTLKTKHQITRLVYCHRPRQAAAFPLDDWGKHVVVANTLVGKKRARGGGGSCLAMVTRMPAARRSGACI